jgi:pantetheine-phosphate adenylyltransferase
MGVAAVFPATFDPVTNGHVALIERTARLFDRLIVGVYVHPGASWKRPLFTADERVRLVREAVGDLAKVHVEPFDGMAVDFARAMGAGVIVRGLRVADDFEFERQMAMMNGHLAPEIETVLLISEPSQAFVSASLVREVALMGGDVSRLVPAVAAKALAEKRRLATVNASTSQGGCASWTSTT